MALQFVFGSAGSGKSELVCRETLQHAQQFPDQNHFVIVPEQFTLSAQKKLVILSGHHGIMNVEALSYERLAYRVFDELGTNVYDILEDTGKSLLLRRITIRLCDELSVLSGNIHKNGFIDELKSLITEFCQYNVGPDDLGRIAEGADAQLRAKLTDIRQIFSAFMEEIEGSYIVAERILELLSLVCRDSVFLKDSYVVFDGFTGFTPVQNRFFTELLHLAQDIRIVVTMDPRENVFGENPIYELFYMSKKFAASVTKMAREAGTQVLDPQVCKTTEGRRFVRGGRLAQLERNLFRRKGEAYRKTEVSANAGIQAKTPDGRQTERNDAKWAKTPDGERTDDRREMAGEDAIELYRLSDPRAELKFAAADIRRSVKEDGTLRYRDIAVLCANMETYRHYIKDIFGTYDIPVFIDAKADVTQHHFVQFLSCLPELFVSDFSYDAVMRYVKSAFSPLTFDEADALDNYLTATNLRGLSRWNKPFTRKLTKDGEELVQLNAIREKLLAPFDGNTLPKRATVESMTRTLYMMIAAHNCEERLSEQAKHYEEAGEEAKAKETEQMYGAVIALLDKFVFLLGEEETGLEEYRDILNEGLSSLSVGVLPPQADTVMFGDIERTRLDAAHTIYFIGINDNAIPKTDEGGGLITQAERMKMSRGDIELAPSERERSFTQRFYLYLAMTKPTRRLVLTYANASADGEGLRPSYLIGVVRRLFPDIAVRTISDEELLFFEMTEDLLLDSLSDALRRYAMGRGDADNAAFLEWLSYLRKARPDAFEELLSAGFYTHSNTPIQRAVMQAVHQGELPATVSRLERYAACAYSYFLSYELRLKERLQYEMDARDLGNLYHKVLEYYARLLREQEEDWQTITDERRGELLLRSCKRAFDEWCEGRGEEPARQLHVYERMKETLHRTVWALTEQIRQGDFAPNRFEVHLGALYADGQMRTELSDGTMLSLDGIVDRIDTAETEDAVYIKIIDYKSGNVDVDLSAIYEGLQLQLILYLKAVGDSYSRLSRKTVVPAAMLYYHIDNPLIEEVTALSDGELAQLVLKELKARGLVAAEKDVLYALDHGTKNAPYRSFSIPVEIKKDGGLSKTSKVADRGQFEILTEFAEKKTIAISERIMSGDMPVQPYRRTADDTACKFCPYHSVCGFEKYLDGFAYRRIAAKESADAVIAKMQAECREGVNG